MLFRSQGRYCHICGQENIEPKETFRALATHLVYDIMHFDSKFFSTLKYLLFKPGFLSHEYLRGRRASYLHPIKMYVFTSAVFFILFFSFIVNPEEVGKTVEIHEETTKSTQFSGLRDSLELAGKNATTDEERKNAEDAIKGLIIIAPVTKPAESGLAERSAGYLKDSVGGNADRDNDFLDFAGNVPGSVKEYDSLQNALPEKKRDNWLERKAIYRSIMINEKYHGDSEKFREVYFEKFFHSVPQMMFVSLPLIALMLMMLYIRKRKAVFYVNHIIFIIHVFIAVYISLLVFYGLDALYAATGWSVLKILRAATGVYIFFYCLIAMYKFYGQGFIKTAFKYFILLFVCSILSALVLGIFLITAYFQV